MREMFARNPITYEEATARERIAELAQIMAAALTRVLARESSQNFSVIGESSLHISPAESGHPTLESRRTQNG